MDGQILILLQNITITHLHIPKLHAWIKVSYNTYPYTILGVISSLCVSLSPVPASHSLRENSSFDVPITKWMWLSYSVLVFVFIIFFPFGSETNMRKSVFTQNYLDLNGAHRKTMTKRPL